MRHFLLLGLILLVNAFAFAQIPPGIPYQAIARNTNGTPYTNASLSVRFSLHEQTATGTVSYAETKNLQTNDLGLFSTTFGSGTPITGTFAGINWAQTTKFLQVEINLGSAWVDMGTQQLMSVPYALFSAVSGSANSTNSTVNPTISSNASGNYSSVTGIQVPSFLKYYGDCSNGNKICANNELISTNSRFCNLTIPLGVTARVDPAVRTTIYVKDTLFLYGAINGSGANNSVSATNATSNHLGATASHFNFHNCSSGGSFAIGTGNSSFNFSWTANQTPSTYYQQFDGSISKQSGIGICGMECIGYNGIASSGQDMTVNDLLQVVHFGANISGANGQATASGSGGCQINALGGQGGAGLYIIARNVILNGSIVLNGGNGTSVTAPCNSSTSSASAGGGAGSCILSAENIISSQNFVFQANGGNAGFTPCGFKGGNGSMLIIK